MVAGLDELNAISEDFVHQAVGLAYAPRPHVATEVFQVLRLADSIERIAQCGLHQVEHSEGRLPVGVDPVAQILQALVLEDGTSSRSRSGIQGAIPDARRNAARSADLVRPRRARVSAARRRAAFAGDRRR